MTYIFTLIFKSVLGMLITFSISQFLKSLISNFLEDTEYINRCIFFTSAFIIDTFLYISIIGILITSDYIIADTITMWPVSMVFHFLFLFAISFSLVLYFSKVIFINTNIYYHFNLIDISGKKYLLHGIKDNIAKVSETTLINKQYKEIKRLSKKKRKNSTKFRNQMRNLFIITHLSDIESKRYTEKSKTNIQLDKIEKVTSYKVRHFFAINNGSYINKKYPFSQNFWGYYIISIYFIIIEISFTSILLTIVNYGLNYFIISTILFVIIIVIYIIFQLYISKRIYFNLKLGNLKKIVNSISENDKNTKQCPNLYLQE